MMQRRLLCFLTIFVLCANVSSKSKFSESESLHSFIQSVDPANNLRFKGLNSNPCLLRWKGIKCLLNSNSIVEVSLDNMNLSGIIDTNTLCNLPNLRVLNLARNHIHGNIPKTVSRCSNLRYLNLSNNLLDGSVPKSLYNLKNLKIVDLSNNFLTWEKKQKVRSTERHTYTEVKLDPIAQNDTAAAPSGDNVNHAKRKAHHYVLWAELGLAIVLLVLLAFFVNLRIAKYLREKKTAKNITDDDSSPKTSIGTSMREVKQDEKNQELVFFVDEKDQFKLENLFDAGADMQNQNFCSSLYKVQLNNNVAYAVKRLKKLPASYDDFNRTMTMVGRLNHPNILPLVAYSCQGEEKLLIYKYQNKGSLLSLMERYVEGKRDFNWKLRLSIAVGIARGMDYIYRSFEEPDNIIAHGNIKLSNILLNENEEPLISEYGYSSLLDPKSVCLFRSNGYTAPERCLSEQGDVFSFGVILLELLTGKIVENSGLDLPKWVKAMVREEWTGEVFDKEMAKVGMYAFPLLNVALKCVSHFAENRPSMAEVLETIVGVVDDDLPGSSPESSPLDGHGLYSVAEEEV
ncbi:putative inactive receptor-like protein kinase At1g64210 [Rutidosis leptorrhynchoides]|uniref:putative inactive receptor-like protein kinase At1g64210 n=1 Tax=Rutidosis leptorrhynchoides TaxID=125765 RepID=UPI003A994A0C